MSDFLIGFSTVFVFRVSINVWVDQPKTIDRLEWCALVRISGELFWALPKPQVYRSLLLFVLALSTLVVTRFARRRL